MACILVTSKFCICGTQDLRSAVQELKADPSCCPDGMAPMYGLAAVSPDRSLINEFLIAYQDVLLSGA